MDRLLREIYAQIGVPRDQYKRRPKDMALLGSRWRKLSGRDDSPEELIRYIKNQQKAKSRLLARGEAPWPTFNGSHKRAPEAEIVLDDKQMEVLRGIYEAMVIPLGIGVDLVEADTNLVAKLAKAFAKLTGMIVSGLALVCIAEEKRKRGLWFKVGRHGSGGIGFDDMDQIDKVDEDDRA
ncbi:MAG: hypothetical protein WD738_09935 [Pirellulales bacterium]